jgi:hypothetical protein
MKKVTTGEYFLRYYALMMDVPLVSSHFIKGVSWVQMEKDVKPGPIACAKISIKRARFCLAYHLAAN